MKAKLARLGALASATLASASAFAVDPTTALEGFTEASTAAMGFGPGMWALAAGSVGIMIGVKWIKRSRGAA